MNEHDARKERIGTILLMVAAFSFVVALGFLIVERRFTFGSEIALAVAGALLLAFIIIEPTRTRTWVTSRQVRYGSNAVFMTLVLLAILVMVNVLADRHSYRVDVTANRRLSLSPQTVELLRSLEAPVQVVGFFPGASERSQAADLLDQYAYHYRDLAVSYHDPVVEPGRAAQWGVTDTWRPTVFITYQGRQETIRTVSEREVTSALVRLVRATEPVVYFLTGHGEPQIDDASEIGLSLLRSRLEQEGFRVAPLNLLVTGTVPSDASVVVMMTPRYALGADVVERFTSYVEDGGAAMILLDPPFDSGADTPELLEWLNDRWGVVYRSDLVIDQASYIYPYPAFPLAARYGSGPIGAAMGGMTTYFPEARSIGQSDDLPPALDVDFAPLVLTSADSWGESDLAGLLENPEQRPFYDEGVDVRGPLNLAVTVESYTTGARMVLFGDSHFCANVSVRDLGNADLFINSLNWLTEDEELISIRPQDDVDRYVIIRSDLVRSLLFLLLVLVLPLAVGGLGVLVFVVRKVRR